MAKIIVTKFMLNQNNLKFHIITRWHFLGQFWISMGLYFDFCNTSVKLTMKNILIGLKKILGFSNEENINWTFVFSFCWNIKICRSYTRSFAAQLIQSIKYITSSTGIMISWAFGFSVSVSVNLPYFGSNGVL